MTEETATMYLDYSKPPPGYVEDFARRVGDFGVAVGWWVNGRCYKTEAKALAAAWAHYKAEHDPPGLTEIFGCGGLVDGGVVRGLKFRFGIASDEKFYPDRAAARAAAWAWHDRRHAIAVDIEEQTGGQVDAGALLSKIIAWTEAECTDVEAYAALPFPRSVDMPAALRRVLLPEPAR